MSGNFGNMNSSMIGMAQNQSFVLDVSLPNSTTCICRYVNKGKTRLDRRKTGVIGLIE
jgi:hypothetical protein